MTMMLLSTLQYIRYESFLGATDSAVPCAMLLHLGYVLQKLNVSNSEEEGDNHVSPQFIFFDGREPFNDGKARAGKIVKISKV